MVLLSGLIQKLKYGLIGYVLNPANINNRLGQIDCGMTHLKFKARSILFELDHFFLLDQILNQVNSNMV